MLSYVCAYIANYSVFHLMCTVIMSVRKLLQVYDLEFTEFTVHCKYVAEPWSPIICPQAQHQTINEM